MPGFYADLAQVLRHVPVLRSLLRETDCLEDRHKLYAYVLVDGVGGSG
jgi:hypothetical protein